MYQINKIKFLQIGVQGENDAINIEIDMTSWVKQFPDAVFHILFKPYNASTPSPMLTTYADGVLTWTVGVGATAVVGVGYTEVRAQDASTGLIKKSRIIPTSVDNSVSGVETTPPASYQEWVTDVLNAGTDAKNSAAAAMAYSQGKQIKFEIGDDEDPDGMAGHLLFYFKDEEDEEWEDYLDLGPVDVYATVVAAGYTGTKAQWIQSIQDAEANAQKSEKYAVGKVNGTDVGSDDPTYHNNSKYYSEQAAAAKTAAEAAQAAAETAAQTDLVAWLEQNITNPDSPPLDRTLSSSSSATPADITGDLKSALEQFIENDDVNILCNIPGIYYDATNTQKTSGAYRTSDYIKIPSYTSQIKVGNSFVYKSNQTKYYLNATVLFYDSNKTFISAESYHNTDWVTVTSIPTNAVYVRINQPNQNSANIENPYYGVWFIIDTWKFVSVAEKQILVDGADLHNLEPNKVYNIPSSSSDIANKPYNSFTGIVATIRSASANTAQFVFAMDGNRRVFVCNSWGAVPGTYNTWKELLGSDGVKKTEGFVGSFTATFPYDSKPFRYSEITMQPNTTYRIKFIDKPKTVRIYVHGYGNGTNYKLLQPWENELYFTNDSTARIIGFYPIDGIDPGMLEESFTVEVYTADSVLAKADDVPRVYKVAKDSKQGDFTSVTACFLALKDDHRPKVVEIYEGDYDIYSEYVAANVPVFPTSMKRSEPYIEDGEVKYHDVDITPTMNFPEYCVFIPENTHVIGHGVVRLIWSPNPANDSITWMQCNAVSPVNVMGSMTLENVEIVCKNGRYCIHNDTIGLAPYAATTLRFINVKCYKYVNDADTTTTPGSSHSYGYDHTVGYGMGLSMHHEYENCDFFNSASGRAFYGHTNQKYNGAFITEAQSGEIILKNCIMDTNGNECVKLGNSGSVQRHVRVKFDDCYFSGQINAVNEGGSTPVANAYDITFLDCGDVSVHYQDPNNPYTPKGYRTNVTIN